MIDPARKVKMQSRVIGWETDEYVIVEQPVHGTDSVQLKKETTIIIRGIHGGEILGFQSSVIGQTINPFRMVFLSYPSKLEKHDFRKDRIKLLVASDVAARGLDIPAVSHIFPSCHRHAMITPMGHSSLVHQLKTHSREIDRSSSWTFGSRW